MSDALRASRTPDNQPLSLQRAVANHLRYNFLTDLEKARPQDLYQALALSVRDRLADRWAATRDRNAAEQSKQVYYLSAEFLLGRLLDHNLLCLALKEEASGLFASRGLSLEAILAEEAEPGLGNGGLGRLAACFLESLATRAYPGMGYGIRYEFGIFEQELRKGWQIEKADTWLQAGNPWEITREAQAVEVKLFGREEHATNDAGEFCVRWSDAKRVLAIPHDLPIAGFRNDTVNSLRLWRAAAPKEFNFALFNEGDYRRAVDDKVMIENISKVLYPNDETDEGKLLRLKQQYFFVSASLQDIIRRFFAHGHTDLRKLPQHGVLQLNDTHPSVAVAELMRLLIDEHRLAWETAWEITTQCVNYTNHTLLPEALECWPVAMFQRLLPRHLSIIYEINRRFLRSVHVMQPQDTALQKRLSITTDDGNLRMAHLAVIGSRRVNGVSKMHSELVKETLLPEFYKLTPEKFCNVTNGVNHRRWLYAINRPLCALLDEALGSAWVDDLQALKKLRVHASDSKLLEGLDAAKLTKKRELANWLKAEHDLRLDPEAIFDVHIKRIHEYKRQLLNCLHIVALYRELKAGGGQELPPRVFLFAGKAAPGYATAKLHIKLINDVAALINQDPVAQGRLQVAFLPNYGVALAERLIPATDVSEQISTAGYEASGTGNMKFSLNGAATLGTLDGANVELRDAIGEEHFWRFGHTVDELNAIRRSGYTPEAAIAACPQLAGALDALEAGWFCPEQPERYRSLVAALRERDPYFVCADFQSYAETQARLAAHYQDRGAWRQSMLHCVAGAAGFSSDRSIDDYARDIWRLER